MLLEELAAEDIEPPSRVARRIVGRPLAEMAGGGIENVKGGGFARPVLPFVLSCMRPAQWLSRGTPLVWARRWYWTAFSSTAPVSIWPTSVRWISCHGVWCSGYL